MSDTTQKPVIFLAFANDRDDEVGGYLRNLSDEARRLSDLLKPAERDGLCEVVVKQNSTAGDIFNVFLDPRYRNRIAVFHYGGHANGYQLLLESAAGESAAADAGGLAKFLGQQRGLHLVFLNGCSTQQQTDGLLAANISAVISTASAIDDKVATDFSSRFYQALATGASIRTAFNMAEAAIQTAQRSNTRGLYYGDKDDSKSQPQTDRWPWNLYLRAGAEEADQWNLPEAVDNPLFGLPPLPELDLPECPYRHLNWFTRKDAEVFFGRSHQIRELYDRLTAPRTPPIMLFYGQSGVGKSSILDAGLIPRLERDYEVRYLRRGAAGLLDTLRLAFLPEASDVPIETAWRVKEEQTGKPLLVFMDQVEEIYTRPIAGIPDELDQLLKVVKETFVGSERRPRGKLVLGFRKEWLAELESQLIAQELPRTKVFLEPLDRRGIIEVVQGPARSRQLREQYRLKIENGLPEIIADDLLEDRDSAIAPTLQILLTKMWTKAREANYEHPSFTQELYQRLKRDGILLRDFLNQQIAKFRERYPEAVDSGLLLDIVAFHTTPLGTADQQTVDQLQQQYAHLGATLPAILQQCQDLYLLTIAASAQKESTKTTRLAHDTLAPLVRAQFEVSDKPGQRARRILDNRAVDWSGNQTGTPLDEADLAVVEKGANGTRALSSNEQRLLEASRDLRVRLRTNRRILKIGGVVAAMMIGIAAFVAIRKSIEANQANLTAVLTASPSELPMTFKALNSSSDAATLRQVRDDLKRGMTPRLHAAFALAQLGQRQDEFLVANLAAASPDEMPNFLHALSEKPDSSIVDQLAELTRSQTAGVEPRIAVTAAAVLVALGQTERLDVLDVRKAAGDPGPRTEFVYDYHRWIGNADRLRIVLESNEANAAALAAICQSLRFSEVDEIRRATTDALKNHATNHRVAAVRAATRSTLSAWGVTLSEVNSEFPPALDRDWYLNKLGMTMIAMPFDADGKARFQWLDIKNKGEPVDVVLTRHYFVADTEVTLQHWNAWPDRPTPPEATDGERALPVGRVTFYQALQFCNWLSDQEKLTRCYKENSDNEWTCDFAVGGYRLPTEAEWRYACRSGAARTKYCYGDDPARLQDFAWTNANSGGVPRAVATRMPNAWGLFDMHGSLLEWCWDWYLPVPQTTNADGKLAVDYAGPKDPDPNFPGRTACGGHFQTGAEDAIADDRGNFSARDRQEYIGFRIVRTMPH